MGCGFGATLAATSRPPEVVPAGIVPAPWISIVIGVLSGISQRGRRLIVMGLAGLPGVRSLGSVSGLWGYRSAQTPDLNLGDLRNQGYWEPLAMRILECALGLLGRQSAQNLGQDLGDLRNQESAEPTGARTRGYVSGLLEY